MSNAGRRTVACVLLAQAHMAIAAITPAAGHGDPVRGEQVYARCMACHALTENRIGPRHCGVFGRRAGSVAGFDYSPAMRRAKIVWNEKTLDTFLRNPLEYLPGTSMVYAGISDAGERADLIAWLKTANAKSPACPPDTK